MACLAAPLVLWVPEGLRACGVLWQRIRTDYARLDAPIEEFGDIDAWRPEASMPGCNVQRLAGLAWLAWLDRLEWLAKLYTLDALEEVGGYMRTAS